MNNMFDDIATSLQKRMFSEYIPNIETLKELMSKMNDSFDLGLHWDPEVYLYSPVKMLPTFVHDVPNGSEEGNYFALDLGGTNLRVFQLIISNNQLESMVDYYTVPHTLMSDDGEKLFDFLSESIKSSLLKWKFNQSDPIDCLGFTFSFPCRQHALNSATLLRWTKGFTAPGVVNEDIVQLLRRACNRSGLNIKDFALINDTTGTLLSGAFENTDVMIGVINGTGTNACYIEDIERVHKWKGKRNKKQILINTEWGAFGEKGEIDFLKKEIDSIIDVESVNPGQQIFEKMVSGLYLGELVRLALIHESEKYTIFLRDFPEKLIEKNSFSSSMVSLSYCEREFIVRFKELFNYDLNHEEYMKIYNACNAFSLRSAGLMAAGLATIVNRHKNKSCTIAADGAIFKKHPLYKEYVEDQLLLLTPKKTEIILVGDGSGKGAALAACVYINEMLAQKNAE